MTAHGPFNPRDWSAHPPYIYPDYRSTVQRGPTEPLIPVQHTLSELTGPVYRHESVGPLDHDMTKNARVNGEPLGERIVVAGRVLDEGGNPVPHTLIEVWQANAAGRYIHSNDQHDAPLDPNFRGSGRCITDGDGRYKFYSVKPGAYPWGNHPNGWRPNHIHFSLFGPSFVTRLVTQMYFPGDPLLDLDPVYKSSPAGRRELLVATFDLGVTEPGYALGYTFDIVLRGRNATPAQE